MAPTPAKPPNSRSESATAKDSPSSAYLALAQSPIERERFLQHLTDNTGRPILYIDVRHVVRFTNKPFQEWISKDESEILNQHASAVFGVETYQFYLSYLIRALAGESCAVETVSRVRVGSSPHIRVSFYPHARSDGKIVGIYVLALDIEEDVQLRQSLVAKELEIRSLADSIGMPLSKSDGNLRYLYVNQVACEWFNRSEEDIIGRTWLDVIGDDQFAQIQQYAERALAGETVFYERFARFPGHPHGHIRVKMMPFRDSTEQVTGVYVVITDFEQDHRLRQEIIHRERQLRLITDSIGLPISYVTADEFVGFYNKTGEEWTGILEKDVLGKPINEAFGENVVGIVRPYLIKAFAGEHVSYERLADFPRRGLRWIRGHLVPDRREDNSVAGVYTVLTDIHDDVLMRDNLLQQERQIRLFTDNIPESIAYIDTKRRYKFVNNTFLRQRGKSRHEIVGRTSEEVLGIETAQLAAPYVARALAGETVTYERLVPMVDGEERWFRVRMVPDLDRNAQAQGIYVVGTDIHDIKMVQATLEISEAELRFAMDSLPYPMSYIDREFRFRMVNKCLAATLGKSREELLGQHLREVYGEKRFSDALPLLQRALAGETVAAERLTGTDPATQRWMTVRYTPRFDGDGDGDGDGNVIGFYSAATDIDELKRTELDLRRANWLLSSHFENTPLAVIEWDPKFCVRRWSPQAEKTFGWQESELTGKHYSEWDFVVDGDVAQADAVSAKLISQKEPRATSLHRNHRKDGRVIWCEWYNSSLRDDAGNIISILSLAQDVTTRVLAEEQLVHQATHDNLTGLPNRAMLQDRLRQAISRARRGGHRIAVMFIDLDRFKDVNDTLGHRIGDELLREISARLSRVVRESDLLVRLSGDEFMVVLEQVTDLESPRFVAEKLLDEIRQPSRIDGHDIHISGSVGISLFPDDAEDVDALLKNADMAMYRAKELGKNTYQIFSADLAANGTAARLMENALRSAVVRNELELYYQPTIDMQSSRITGAEALLRWHHPTRGTVAPGEFMHLAEDAGLVHEIGDWVLDAAFSQARRWHDAGFTDLRLAINLAAGQFRATNLAERIRERMIREGCLPQSIEVEVTETGMLRDPEGVGRTLAALREMGLRVAIDDFGTGYSSLSHLKRFPIDTLKIDKSFVADIMTDHDDTAIVSAVIALARALDIEVIAEGVETEAQRAMLAAQGCDAYQGYLFSRALPAREFEALLLMHARTAIRK
ncbi:MAG: PAS domain-containing protein [Betaproteobacteria bacterium]|nr:PAS domain-containing protein [Betaproteobacteria bacterium]